VRGKGTGLSISPAGGSDLIFGAALRGETPPSHCLEKATKGERSASSLLGATSSMGRVGREYHPLHEEQSSEKEKFYAVVLRKQLIIEERLPANLFEGKAFSCRRKGS